MSAEIWLTYIVTVLLLMSTPGPSQLLMLANGAAFGMPRAYATAIGDLTANMLQMLAAGLGVAALLAAIPGAMSGIQWAGVAYLVWQGIKMWRAEGTKSKQASNTAALSKLWMQGFVTSAVNPKAVVFFAALFPQFIQADGAFWPQFLILSATYLALDGLFLSAYGIGADRLSRRLDRVDWINRFGAAAMIGAAGLLAVRAL